MDGNKGLDDILGPKEVEEVRNQYEIEVAKESAIPAAYLAQLLPDIYDFVSSQYQAGNVKEYNSEIFDLELNLTLTEPTDDPATNALILLAEQIINILKECGVNIPAGEMSGTRLEQVTAQLAQIWHSGFQQSLFSGSQDTERSTDLLKKYPIISNYRVIQDFLSHTATRSVQAMLQHGYQPDPKDLK